ncbi:MAG: GHKL domain-containing protein [Streptococcaceae bacterium]|jgi:hypothetical protein|nr:GHKL domain-containing protein [Streptococcaceae bacterium]
MVQSALIGILFLATIILNFFLRDMVFVDEFSMPALVFVIITTILLSVFVLILFLAQGQFYATVHQLELENQSINGQIAQFELTKKAREQIIRIQHDLKNDYLVMIGMLECGESENVSQLLRKKLKNIDDSDFFYTNHSVLNFLLNHRCNEAKKRSIDLKITVLLADSVRLDNQVLAVVLGNLLDNAFAAVLRNEKGNQWVQLEIKSKSGYLWIRVANRFNTNELKSRQKRQLDGWGIHNIKRVVADKNGLYESRVKDDLYETTIIFFDS